MTKQQTPIRLAQLPFEDKEIKYYATNYTQLTTVVAPIADDGNVAVVAESEGTRWLPGSVGGTYYPPGIYVWVVDKWVSDKLQISELLDRLDTTTAKTYKTITQLLKDYPANVNNEIALDPNVVYLIDSNNFDMGVYCFTGTDITITGYSQNVNKITSSQNDKILISCTGNLFLKNIEFEVTGTNSLVIEMNGASGFESLDMDTVSFLNCVELGQINGIRQFFWRTGFAFGSSSGFTFDGTMSGGVTCFDSRIINLDYTLRGAATMVLGSNGSVRSNANVDVGPGQVFCDFDYVNFSMDEQYQLQGCKISGDGEMASDFTSGDATEAQNSTRSFFKGNTGMKGKNTLIGISWTLTTEVLTPLDLNVRTKFLGTTTQKNAVHWSQVDNNRIEWLSQVERDQIIKGYFIVDGGPSDELRVHIIELDETGTFVQEIESRLRSVSNFVGGLDLAYYYFEEDIRPQQNYKYEIHVTNETDGTDATLAIGSFVRVNNTVG